jgi:hypothetical protein
MDMYAEFLKSVFGAFAGAFFAFLFLRLAEGLKSLYDRKCRHHHGLIKLEYQGNMLLDAIGCNEYEIDQIIQSFELGEKTGQITIPANRPVPFQFDEQVLYDLANIEMINEVLSYSVQIKRFNSDIAGIVSLYDLFKTALLQGNLSKENYIRNYAICVSKFKELRAHLAAFETRTKRLVAMAVVRARCDRPILNRLLHLSIRTRHERSFETAVTKHLTQQEKDIQMVRERSRREIERVRSKQGETEPESGHVRK